MSDRRPPRERNSDRLDRKARHLAALFREHWISIVLVLAGVGFYVLLARGAERLPGAVLGALLCVAAVPLALLSVQLYAVIFGLLQGFEPVGRLKRLGPQQLAALFLASYIPTLGWFSALALFLDRRTAVDFRTRGGDAIESSGQLMDFFVWHVLDQFPIVDAATTLQWEVPLTYSGGGGVLVLLFKFFVIVPVVTLATLGLQAISTQKPAGAMVEPS